MSAVVLRLAEILRELAREHGRRDVRGERDDLRAVVVTRHRGRIVLIRRCADDAARDAGIAQSNARYNTRTGVNITVKVKISQ